jgi:hypothetical protein
VVAAGTLLVLVGSMGATVGACLYGYGLVWAELDLWTTAFLVLWFVSFACLLIAGFILLSASRPGLVRATRFTGTTLVALAVTLFVGISGVIIVFSVCSTTL